MPQYLVHIDIEMYFDNDFFKLKVNAINPMLCHS